MKTRSRTRRRRRRQHGKTRRFQIFWWWGPTPAWHWPVHSRVYTSCLLLLLDMWKINSTKCPDTIFLTCFSSSAASVSFSPELEATEQTFRVKSETGGGNILHVHTHSTGTVISKAAISGNKVASWSPPPPPPHTAEFSLESRSHTGTTKTYVSVRRR